MTGEDLFGETPPVDPSLDDVVAELRAADPIGERAAHVFRSTFDQLYDGQRTGRYKWDQLFKTEKTHFGTLIEINLRREFDGVIIDGRAKEMDYRIAGHDIDCKYSQREGGWMLPPECFGELLLVSTASDKDSTWSLGVVRALDEYLRPGSNRDAKTGLNISGRNAITWLFHRAVLPPNVLLQMDPSDVDAVFASKKGQQRLNELFRRAEGRRVGRATVATVAQQEDYMKRVRANGGSRSLLAFEGYIIPGGDYASHRQIAESLGATVPGPGEFVSMRVVHASADDANTVELDGKAWRLAGPTEPSLDGAPVLPDTRKAPS